MQDYVSFKFTGSVAMPLDTDNNFDIDKFHQLVESTVGLIKLSADGIISVEFFRFGLRVNFLNEIVDRNTVVENVLEIMTNLIDEAPAGLFPFKDKHDFAVTVANVEDNNPNPELVLRPYKDAKEGFKIIFSSEAIAIQSVPATHKFDSEAMRRLLHPMLIQLIDITGILDYDLTRNSFAVDINTDKISREEFVAYAELIIRSFVGQPQYFPYLSDVEDLDLMVAAKN